MRFMVQLEFNDECEELDHDNLCKRNTNYIAFFLRIKIFPEKNLDFMIIKANGLLRLFVGDDDCLYEKYKFRKWGSKVLNNHEFGD
jgi:hypothetical protein